MAGDKEPENKCAGSSSVRPPRFRKEEGLPFSKWIKRFEICAQANGWDAAKRFLILPTCLEGEAFEAYLDIRDQVTDFDGLVDQLTREYLPVSERRIVSAQLFQARQERGQSAEAFARHLKQLALDSGRDVSASATQELLEERFVLGLHPDTRDHLLREKISGWTKVVERARELEALKRINTGLSELQGELPRPPTEPAQAVAACGDATIKKVVTETAEAMQEQFVRWLSRMSDPTTSQDVSATSTPQRGPSGTFPGQCFRCGRYGHRKIDCRVRQTPPNQNRFPKKDLAPSYRFKPKAGNGSPRNE